MKITSLSQLLIGVCAFYSMAQAAEFQSLQSIRMQAEDFIRQYPYETPYLPHFEVNHLDDRLRLKACNNPLIFEFSRQNKTRGNTALNVRCKPNSGWKLILPVRIELFDDVLVAAQSLHKGQFIGDQQVSFQKKNISRLNSGYYSQSDSLLGLEAKRNIKRGTILTPQSLRPRLLVKSGQQVTILLNYKGLHIKSSGRALQSARRGEVVKVRNNQSNRVVEGIVSGEAQVSVNI
ncbi:MAG: flagellar basal body P-ring formation protein FlgA [Gammaproteobacteria bacterium]|nr:flagellar basal body P-ring formation protein FlgA [Gammaproteobacteria bacterium]